MSPHEQRAIVERAADDWLRRRPAELEAVQCDGECYESIDPYNVANVVIGVLEEAYDL